MRGIVHSACRAWPSVIRSNRARNCRRDVTTESRKPTRRRRGGRRRKPREASSPPEPIAPEPPAPVEPVPEPASSLLPLAEPEVVFAGRAAARPPEPERPLPTTRRAIFFDVENASRVQPVSRVIDHLAVDRLGRRTDFIAVGNWRVIGHDAARLLAGHGAQLLHSAPSVGVKDWSDLRIAVAAGVWLGTARPGDALEIISDDRAFDAVGDVATSLGITFRRLSYRRLTGLPTPAPISAVVEPQPQAPAEPSQGGGRPPRGRGGPGGGGGRRGGGGAGGPRTGGPAGPPRPGAGRARGGSRAPLRAARRAAWRGAGSHPALARRHRHARFARQRAEGARLQPAGRVPTPHHPAAADPRAVGEPLRADHARRGRPGAGARGDSRTE